MAKPPACEGCSKWEHFKEKCYYFWEHKKECSQHSKYDQM